MLKSIFVFLKGELNISSYATWNQVGETVAGLANGTAGSSTTALNSPVGISISKNDVLYVCDGNNNRTVVIPLTSINQVYSINLTSNVELGAFRYPYDAFATNTSLYVNDKNNRRVIKMTSNGSDPTIVLNYSNTHTLYYMFVDDYANIYLSDRENHTVLFFCSNSSNFTVVAGNGVNGSNYTQLNRPYGIYVDHMNTLYIADHNNHRIMKWNHNALTGILVAGNGTPGNSLTQLNFPTQIIVDKNGYIFISEQHNHRITRWAPNSTYGICIAACTGESGSSSYQLKNPHFLAFDSNGSLYVSDWLNNRVQKFQIRHNQISYNQPKLCPNAAWNENGSILLNYSTIGSRLHTIFIDINKTVSIVNHDTNQISICHDVGNCEPYNQRFHFQKYPNLFVINNREIYYVNNETQSEIYKRSIGATGPTFVTKFTDTCYSLFIDTNNYLYCNLRKQHRIARFSLDINITNFTTLIGQNTSGSDAYHFAEPYGIFVDKYLNLYVADSSNNRIQRFLPGQTIGVTVAGHDNLSNITLDHPTDVILDADDNLYIVDNNKHRIIRSIGGKLKCIIACSGQNGSRLNQLYIPYAMRFDSYGHLYVVDEFNNRSLKFNLATNYCDSSISTTTTINPKENTTVTATVEQFPVSYNLPWFCDNPVWDFNGTTILTKLQLKNPNTILITTNNTAYVTDSDNRKILMWILSDRNESVEQIENNSWNNPKGLAVTTNNEVYIDSDKDKRICKCSTQIDECECEMVSDKQCPNLFVDINNTIYCSAKYAHQIIKTSLLTTAKDWTITAGIGTSGKQAHELNEPCGIFVDKDFTLYVADSNNNRVQRFKLGNPNGSTVVGQESLRQYSLNKPHAVILDAGNYLYIVDNGNHRIVRVREDYFECLIGCSCTHGNKLDQLHQPNSIAFDSFGNIFVVDSNNNRIQKFHLITNNCNKTSLVQSNRTTNVCPSISIATLSSTVFRLSTISDQVIKQNNITNSSIFIPPTCNSSTVIGLECSISATVCDLLDPCKHNSSCINNDTSQFGYTCNCSSGFHGIRCEKDRRNCTLHICFHGGTCHEHNSTCSCPPGWQGHHCQHKFDYCQGVSCHDHGICRSLPDEQRYICECFGDSYYGEHCEHTQNQIVIKQTVSKSFAYVAILALSSVALFVLIMDVLKYCFGIDPVDRERHRLRRERQAKKRKHKPVIQRFTYVNRSTTIVQRRL